MLVEIRALRAATSVVNPDDFTLLNRKRIFAALEKKTNGSDMDISDEDIGADDAGNAFGGKVSKKKKHQE